MVVTWEEYNARKQERHESHMRGCTSLEKEALQLPYAKYMPYTIINNGNRLQCRDMVERNFWYGCFAGMFIGCYFTARVRFGDMVTP